MWCQFQTLQTGYWNSVEHVLYFLFLTFNIFILLNGWICLHDVLDYAGSKSVFERI